MTPAETLRVVAVLAAAFPREPMTDATAALWQGEIATLPFAEAMAAARATYQNHEFLTVAAFRTELAAVRERRADEHPWPGRALYPANDPLSTPEQSTTWIARCREALATCQGPLSGPLQKALQPDEPKPWRRPDEGYFEPPAPNGSEPANT